MGYDARDPDNGDVLWSDGDQLLLSFDSPTVRLGSGLGLGLGLTNPNPDPNPNQEGPRRARCAGAAAARW